MDQNSTETHSTTLSLEAKKFESFHKAIQLGTNLAMIYLLHDKRQEDDEDIQTMSNNMLNICSQCFLYFNMINESRMTISHIHKDTDICGNSTTELAYSINRFVVLMKRYDFSDNIILFCSSVT